MDKKQAIGIINEAAEIFNDQYCSHNILIIYGNLIVPSFAEIKATDENFLHLTGVKLNCSAVNNSPNKFFEKAVNRKLTENEFEYKDSTTIQKLHCLVQALYLPKNAKMFCDYSNCRINLKTDKLAGGVKSFIGFCKVGKYYVPNTVMEDDIRKNSKKTERVLAILSKKVEDLSYNKIESVAKKIDIIDLLRKISDKVPIDPTLLQDEHSIEKDTAATLSKCHQIEEWGSKLEQKVEQEHGIKKEVSETNRGSR